MDEVWNAYFATRDTDRDAVLDVMSGPHGGVREVAGRLDAVFDALDSVTCACGHSASWHTDNDGDKYHPCYTGRCECAQFTPARAHE